MNTLLKSGDIMKEVPHPPMVLLDRTDERVQEFKRIIIGYAKFKAGLSEETAKTLGDRVVAILTQ